MTHYLRNSRNETLLDIETTKDDIRVVVCIKAYSNYLIYALDDIYKQVDFMQDFHDLSELRAEWFEAVRKDESPNKLAERRLKEIADKWHFSYITD